MRVFLLGGYGAVGKLAAKLLAESDVVSQIAIAGRVLERAEGLAEEIGVKACAVKVDGADEHALAAELDGFDLVINAARNEVAPPIMKAAIRAKAHYCDVGFGSDFISQMKEFDPQMKAAGATAIICTGTAPCLTNLMGVHAASQLEETEQLQNGRALVFEVGSWWTLSPKQWHADPAKNLAVMQRFRSFFGWFFDLAKGKRQTIRLFQDGAWVDVDPVTSGIEAPVLGGGMIKAFPYLSTEPLFDSLPTGLSTQTSAQVWVTTFPPQLHELVRKQAISILDEGFDPETALGEFYTAIDKDPQKWLSGAEEIVPFPADWVTAVGYKDGRPARYTCWLTQTMWDGENPQHHTSGPLAAAVLKILRGEIPGAGVYTAEEAFPPMEFFTEFATVLPQPPLDGRIIGETFEWLS